MTVQKIDESGIELTEAITDAVWERIRSLTLATAKYENFVRLGVAVLPENGELKKTIWEGFNPDDDPKSMAMDFIFMSLKCALEPKNTRILLNIGDSESVSPTDLAKQLDTGELIVRERIGELFQSGFVGKNYESGTIYLTDAGKSLVKMLKQIVDRLALTIMEKLPDLVKTGKKSNL